PVVEASRVDDLDPNTPGNQAGTKIIVKDPETGAVVHESYVKDGQDGKSPEITSKDNGDGTHTITIKNPDGTSTTTTVKDGKDGKAPVVETSRVEDADPNTPDNQPGTKITVKDPDTGKVINETFVKDGKDGK
ncbi:hypothetical protein QP463_09295, partial [Actinotignum schaalii]|nr:hypothetical protein [Actinotignum schaalii]